MPQPVMIEVHDDVGIITFNRPERLNALNAEAGGMFEQAMADFAVDSRVKVIVITGAGDRGFCVGADIERLDSIIKAGSQTSAMPRPGASGPLDNVPGAPFMARARYTAPLVVPKPVIAAVNGACAGIGLSLACCCDIRFASSNATFAAGFPRRGLTAEVAVAWTLHRIVGHGAASDILLSGRKLAAIEAQSIGLINRVLEPDALIAHALAYARDIATNASPRSTAVIKRQLHLATEQSFAEAVMLSFDEQIASLASEDFKEGVASFKERRPPNFSGG